jgi:hypothetical protein
MVKRVSFKGLPQMLHPITDKRSTIGSHRAACYGAMLARCKVADYLRIRAALRKLSANGSTLFANGDSRSVMPVLNTRDRKWLDKIAL